MIFEFGILVLVGFGKLFLFIMFIFSKILNRSYLNFKMRYSISKIFYKGKLKFFMIFVRYFIGIVFYFRI